MSENIGIFNPLKKWKSGDMPMTVAVHIVLNRILGNDDEGFPLLSPSLASDTEIDFEIDGMISALNKARTNAKKVLKLQRAKMLKKTT